MKRPAIGVGLIGYGKAGRVFHAPLIAAVDGFELRKIVQRHGHEAPERYPQASVVREVDELVADDGVDLVVVATPNDSHVELARRALLAGKHVVVDKPFTLTSVEADELISLARERGRILTAFQNRRWDGDFLTVRRLLEQQAFGRLVSFEARYDRYRNQLRRDAWQDSSRPGTGALYDLGSHLIDQALVLFGQPASIVADVRRERDFGPAADAFEIWMQYPGLKVTLRAAMLVRETTPRFTLRGTDATFVKFGLDPQEEALAAGRSPNEAGWGREMPEHWGTLLSDRGEQKIETEPGHYAAFYENVRDTIAGEASLAVKPEEARATIQVIERALASAGS